MLQQSVGLGLHKFVDIGTITAPSCSDVTELARWCKQLVWGKNSSLSRCTLRTFYFASWARFHQLMWPAICEMGLARTFTCGCNRKSRCKHESCMSGTYADQDTICSSGYPQSTSSQPRSWCTRRVTQSRSQMV